MVREGRRRRPTRDGSIKFLVALQSMRAVVVTVLPLYRSLMGNRKARSDLLATITEAMSREEEDVTASSCFKKTAPRFHRHLPSLLHVSLSLLPPISRWFVLALGFE